MYLEIALKYKVNQGSQMSGWVKQSKDGKFPSNYKLAQSILKRKISSVLKPLQK